jgi:hypothetical protein
MFRLDFKNAFSLFSHWGEILSKLSTDDDFNSLGAEVGRGILAGRENDRNERVYNLAIRVNELDGSFEQHPFKSHESLTKVFRHTNDVLSMIDVQEYARVGVRFIFLGSQDDFDQICSRLVGNLSQQYLALFEHRPSDLTLTTVHADGNEKMRLSVGPIRRDEYKQWFVSQRDIEQESTILFDVDCFAAPFKGVRFDLEKLVSLYYAKSLEQVERVTKFVNNGSQQ